VLIRAIIPRLGEARAVVVGYPSMSLGFLAAGLMTLGALSVFGWITATRTIAAPAS
jgi:hypothetical protein